MERLPTRLDGLVLLAPTVHGDERGFFMETYREDAWGRHGIPSAFVQDNHSRSRRGTLRGIHFQTHPGQGKLVRVARGRVLDVAVDLRRGSPTFGEWESFELDDVHGRQLWIPVGFGHGFCVLSDEADFVYKCTNYYDAATESGISFADPDVGIEWPRAVELLYSERDRDAPRLAEIADELPFTYWRVTATAASLRARPGRCTSATCARRCWRGCSPARRARASSCGWRTSTRGACGWTRRPSSSRTCARSGSTGTARCCGSRRGSEAYEAAIARLRADGPRLRVLLHAGGDPRGGVGSARAAARGRLPRHLPAADRRRAAAQARRRAAAGAAAARRRGADRGSRTGWLGRYEMAVDDFVVRRNDGAAAYNLAVMVDDAAQGIGEVVRGADLIDSTPRQVLVARLLGLPEPSWAHVPLVLGPDGARLAKRHGSVTLRDVDAGRGGAVDGADAGLRGRCERGRDARALRSGAAAARADAVRGGAMRRVVAVVLGAARGRARGGDRSAPSCSRRSAGSTASPRTRRRSGTGSSSRCRSGSSRSGS